ncbi:helix-turn-helix domain-containing protein [Chitinophaga deserti]|uniref:helix-turn-helix domain-containing protein n=1 Tax=Chitinophaga deserti TaxID=2164099 RepID=UPI000D6D07B5|nr:AraC family transcriptional regulator [Chitinophaga deserti]
MDMPLLPTKTLWIDSPPVESLPVASMPKDQLKGLLPFARIYVDKNDEDKDDCKIVTQEVPLGPISMWFHHVAPKASMILFPQTPFRNVILHVMLGSPVRVLMGNGRLTDLRNQRMDLFNLLDYLNTVPLEEGQCFDSFHINFRPDAAPELIRQFPELKDLITEDILKGEGRLNTRSVFFNEVCQRTLKQILCCKQIGDTAEYFLRRQVVNILTVFLRTMQMGSAAYRLSTKNRLKTAACYHFLRRNFTGQHSAESLSQRFSLEPDLLEACFCARYGRTIQEFILDRRMNVAYHALMRTKASFSTIAADTGFETVAAFRIAFRKYYRVEPVHLIKAQ